MKIYLFLFILLCHPISISAQNLFGAWKRVVVEGDDTLKLVTIFAHDYFSTSISNHSTGAFLGTAGGSWSLENEKLIRSFEFDSFDSNRVGSEEKLSVVFNDSNDTFILSPFRITTKRKEESDINIYKHLEQKWTRIDDGNPGKLNGAWLMSGRKRDGKLQSRDTNRPRKTMKILSGTRFQWIAYHTESKKFMATGGGSYTTIDGNYTETIEFFSRDDNKVGLSLDFNYELVDGNWHHSGFSSKGDAIYEIWSFRRN